VFSEHDTVVMWTGGMDNVRNIAKSRCTRLHDVVELPDTGHWYRTQAICRCASDF
jgi:hypothetical protein